MPENTIHPAYERWQFRWEELRAAHGGLHTVRALVLGRSVPQTTGSTNIRYTSAQNIIIPKPKSMSDDRDGTRAYHAYVMRADWFGATERAVSGLSGIVLRKPGTIELPTEMEPWADNITLQGDTLSDVSREAVEELLLMNRWVLLTDYSQEQGRSYLTTYAAEQLINWREEVIDGVKRLVLAVIQEHVETTDVADLYAYLEEVHYRVYSLAPMDEGGPMVARVDVYSMPAPDSGKQDNAAQLVYRPELSSELTRQGEPLDFLPLQIVPEVTPGKAVLQPLVDKNYTHYRHSADYEHGLFLTGRPTGVITGHQDEDEEYILGGDVLLMIPNEEAKAFFLEYQGAGLSEASARMETDKQEMAMLVSRLLEGQPLVQETATAVLNRQLHEGGSLRKVADDASHALQQALRWAAWWAGLTEDRNDQAIVYQLNRDFVAQQLDPNMFNSLMMAFETGKISYETFFWNLQQGEMYPPGHDMETEQDLIETQNPMIGT